MQKPEPILVNGKQVVTRKWTRPTVLLKLPDFIERTMDANRDDFPERGHSCPQQRSNGLSRCQIRTPRPHPSLLRTRMSALRYRGGATRAALCRRLPVGSVSKRTARPAGWKPATQQVGNLRYGFATVSAWE